MQDKSLLEVSPQDLLGLILSKRQKDASQLPKDEQKRDEELTRAYELYNTSKETLAELVDTSSGQEVDPLEKSQAENIVKENETHRKRVMARLQRVRRQLKETRDAVEYWSAMDDTTLSNLLGDAERVNDGGLSTFAIKKTAQNG